METLVLLKSFFAWCSLLGIGLLLFSTVMVIFCRDWAKKIHGDWFKMDDAELDRAYFQYLAQFKIAVIVFNIVPYFALLIMLGCSGCHSG